MDWLVDDGCAGRADGVGVFVVDGGEDGAFVDDAVCIGDGALFDAGFESVGVPAVEEVAVESESFVRMDVSDFFLEEQRERKRCIPVGSP